MKEFVYLDNAATTKVRPEVVEAMLPYFTEIYGNASAVYDFGQKCKQAIEDARETIGSSIGTRASNIYLKPWFRSDPPSEPGLQIYILLQAEVSQTTGH